MRRLIKNKLRNAVDHNTSKRMYDPSQVLILEKGKVLLKKDYSPKRLLQKGNVLTDGELIYIDLDKIDYSKLKKWQYANTDMYFYLVAKFNVTNTGDKYNYGYLTIGAADKKAYIHYQKIDGSEKLWAGQLCGEFTSNKYGTYGMFKPRWETNTIVESYVDLYHIERMNKIIPGTTLKENTKIYFDTRLATEDASIFATNNYIIGWDSVNKNAVCGTQTLETTLDGFVAIFSVPTEDIVTETYLLCYYEEA